jgi:hypothetical protein
MTSSTSTPRNRRERRAAAKQSASNTDSQEIPMTRPDYDAKPKGKTLLEIAEERKAELMAAAATKQKELDSKAGKKTKVDVEKEEDFDPDAPLGAFPIAVLYTISLSALHLTLDVLVLTQYHQDVLWSEIFGRLAKLTPALLLAVWLSHTEQAKSFHILRQFAFLAVSVAAGCFIIKSGNENGYYLVMQQVPPVGTVWVWSVVEMEVVWSIVHVLTVAGYMWSKGYGAF